MGGKIDPIPLKLSRQGARVRIACLDPIRKEHHSRRILAIAHIPGRQTNGIGQWRFALGAQGLDFTCDNTTCRLGQRDQRFDVAAIALAPVAIGDQANVLPLCTQRRLRIGKGLPRDLNLCHPINLPPHRPRGIKDDHQVLGIGRIGQESRGNGRRRQPQTKGQSKFCNQGLGFENLAWNDGIRAKKWVMTWHRVLKNFGLGIARSKRLRIHQLGYGRLKLLRKMNDVIQDEIGFLIDQQIRRALNRQNRDPRIPTLKLGIFIAVK